MQCLTKKGEQIMNKTTKYLLKDCGIPPHLLGYEYIGEAIELILANRKYLHHITALLYPCIAKKFNTTATKVERAIRHSLGVTFDNLPPEIIEEIFGNTLHYSSGKPTNAHFLAALADMMDE